MKAETDKCGHKCIIDFDCKIWVDKNGDYRDSKYGCAIEMFDGTKYWYRKNKSETFQLHREDGPAIINSKGEGMHFLNDRHYSKEEFDLEIINRLIKNLID